MRITLATTYHDPGDRLYAQIGTVLPLLTQLFTGMAVQVSAASPARSLALLADQGAVVHQDGLARPGGAALLGKVRREAVALALEQDAPVILFFDFDRLLHWAEHYPEELRSTLPHLLHRDMTLVGRTPRAFDSHPRPLRDTEVLVNQLFARRTGYSWDVMHSGRGLSRRAAEAIVSHCPDDRISTDVSWPLFLLQQGGFTFQSVAVEGTEYETGDRHTPEIAAAGGYERWVAQLEADPQTWAARFEMARMHAEAMHVYAAEMRLGQ